MPRKRRKKKITELRIARRNRRFHIFNFCFFAALCVCSFYFLNYLHHRLADYEQSQPKYVVNDVFNEIASGDYRRLYENEDTTKWPDEDYEDYASYISARIGENDVVIKERHSDDKQVKKYALYAGDWRFCNIEMKMSEEKSEFGYEMWTLSSVSAEQIAEPKVFRIRVSESATVYVDKTPIGKDHVTQSGILTGREEQLLENAYTQTECVYTVTRCFTQPEIYAEDAFGRRLTLLADEKGVLAAQTIYEDETYLKAHGALIEKLLKMIANYSVGLDKLSNLRALCAADSNAYKQLYTYSLWNSKKANRARMENVQIDSVIRLGEDSFCVNAACDFICSFKSKDDMTDRVAYTFYFCQQNGKWLLYDFVSQ